MISPIDPKEAHLYASALSFLAGKQFQQGMKAWKTYLTSKGKK